MSTDKAVKQICVITGTRAEYGLLQPVMKAIRAAKGLNLSLIVTGMHLSGEHGRTVDLIVKDGFEIHERVDMLLRGDDCAAMAKSIGIGVTGIAQALARIRPDVVLVLGDRMEALAGAIAAAYMNIVVAHIHGGDRARAGLDDSARHAITKFAHIHFPATETSAERIRKMGERPEHVFVVGAPGLDTILSEAPMARSALARRLGIGTDGELLVVIQHPVTTQHDQAAAQMRETMEAVKALRIGAVAIHPNSDAGGREMASVIEEYAGLPFVKTFRNIDRPTFINLLRHAAVLVGNSSCGVIESASFHLPVVNVGIRQEGRERSVNVLDVGHERSAIAAAVRTALGKAFRRKVARCRNPYGDGRASERIVRTLRKIRLTDDLIQKQITY